MYLFDSYHSTTIASHNLTACFFHSSNVLDAAGTSFDVAGFEKSIVGYSKNADWLKAEEDIFAACKRDGDANLTPRQQAVYSYASVRWSLNADCDTKQEQVQRLDADGQLRRALFLSGDCPMSPSKLLDPFGLVTGRTWGECSQVGQTGEDYAEEVSRVICLLQDFETADGTVDFASLNSAINAAEGSDRSASTFILRSLVDTCTPATGSMSTRDLVKCWASWGLYSCSYKEANELAQQFPQGCSISP